MAAITYTTQLLNGILMLVMLFQTISKGIVSWKRVKEVLHSEADLTDGVFDGQTQEQGEIEFRDVSFIYPGMREKVLSHVTFSIHKGETVAIMGAIRFMRKEMPIFPAEPYLPDTVRPSS